MMYVLRNVSKIYSNGYMANSSISLDIERGEVFGILGPNGAGKTTLVKQMVGLLASTSGTIDLDGSRIGEKNTIIPQTVSYLGQSNSAFSFFTFREIIIHAGIHRGLTKNAAIEEASSLINRFKCEGIANNLRMHLSGGERKLSMLLTAFIALKPVIILDEPTNDLDPAHRAELWQYVNELCRTKNSTIILVTHNLSEAESVIDRMAIIDKGDLIVYGTLGDLKRQAGERIKVEFIIHDNCKYVLSGATHVRGQKWQIITNYDTSTQIVDSIIQAAKDKIVDDFSITAMKLEDVYIQALNREKQHEQ